MPLCRAELLEIRREPWGAVMKIYAEMEGEAGVIRRLYEAVLAARDLRRIERRVGFIRPRRVETCLPGRKRLKRLWRFRCLRGVGAMTDL
jgi:hypothetical protein